MKEKEFTLQNQLLVAMPSYSDAEFSRLVMLVFEHSRKGAIGIAINRPIDRMRFKDVLADMNLEPNSEAIAVQRILCGGSSSPDRGFVLHKPGGKWDHTHKVSKLVQVTTSKDILVTMARGDGPSDAILALGYSNWEAGQLEEELRENKWLSVPADHRILFELPFEDRWERALQSLGLDAVRLNPTAGHA